MHTLFVRGGQLGMLTAALASAPTMAGGLFMYEVANDNAGLANAGAAARAQNPGTLASNVAGMSYLPGTQISGGLQLLHSNLEFTQNGNSNVPGGDSGTLMEWAPGGSLFVTQQIDEHWHVGFATYGDFGLGIDYEDDWAGRYFTQNDELLGLTLQPSVAYHFNDQWSLGFGLRAMYAMLDSQLAIDNSPLDLRNNPDGSLTYKSHDWGFGANLGVIYQPWQGTRIGLNYSSEIELEFEDGLSPEGLGPVVSNRLQATGIIGADTKLTMNVPQTLTLSLYHALNEQWAVLASANWQDWSRFGQVGVQIDSGNPVSATADANFKDTWHLSVGTQYQASKRLLWNLGVGYDSSPVSDEDRTFTMPLGSTWRFGTGLTYALDPQTDLNLSYALVWMGDMQIDQQKQLPRNDPKRVSGEIEDAWVQAVSVNATWRF
ncbi:MAG: outer membrane protein transport protein [Pseudomonas sp.]|nr:outer membrane protein transport protein [Pseudomonas sp.]